MGAKGEFMSANLAWFEAMAIVGRVFTADEQKAGWPPALKPAQIGQLQRPCARTDETGWRFAVALVNAINAACTAGEIEHSTATEHIRKELRRALLMGEPAPQRTYQLIPYEVKLITAQAFANWLAAQQIEPSQHIRAWFAANGISVPEVPVAAPVQGMAAAQGEAETAALAKVAAPVQLAIVPPAETAAERRDRRFQACLAAGLRFPDTYTNRLPDGVGRVADKEGVSRQAFSKDVREGWQRSIEARQAAELKQA